LGREAGLLAMRQPEHRFRAHRCRSVRGPSLPLHH
jgi:hypothetical protein